MTAPKFVFKPVSSPFRLVSAAGTVNPARSRTPEMFDYIAGK
jgi:hypothetical protein